MRIAKIYLKEAISVQVSIGNEKVSDEYLGEIIQKVQNKYLNLDEPVDVIVEDGLAKLIFIKPNSEDTCIYTVNTEVMLFKGDYLILSKGIVDSINEIDKSEDKFSAGDELVVSSVSRYIDEIIDRYLLDSYIILEEPYLFTLEE